MSLSLTKEITIAGSVVLREQLMETIGNGTTEVMIDGSEVDRIDTAALQLLVSFAKTLATHGQTLQWSGISEALHASAKQIGLHDVLGMPTVLEN